MPQSTRDTLEAALAAIEVLTNNLPKGEPIRPHPFGLVVVDAKRRIRAALQATYPEGA